MIKLENNSSSRAGLIQRGALEKVPRLPMQPRNDVCQFFKLKKSISQWGWFMILFLGGLMSTLLLAYSVKLILLMFK